MNDNDDKSNILPPDPEFLREVDDAAHVMAQAVEQIVRKTLVEGGRIGVATVPGLGLGVLFGGIDDVHKAQELLGKNYGGIIHPMMEDTIVESKRIGPCEN